MGKCMYSGEVIDLHKLLNDNLYDIDHIYPQHYIKDDSIENNLVLVKKKLNKDKDDKPLTSKIQADRYTFWCMLKDKGFISSEKFTRLTRRNDSFTEDELTGFINRQIVETSQASKAITQILQQSMGENCKIVFSKAKLVSEFRHKFDLPKSRIVNDLHHANDAYLNIVVGNAYYVKFTGNPYKFIKNAIKDKELNENKYHLSDFYNNDIYNKNEVAWTNKDNKTITTIKEILKRATPIVVKKVEQAHGKYFDETLVGHNKAKKSVYIGQKTKHSVLSNVCDYGGKTSISVQTCLLVEYKKKNEIIRRIMTLPVLAGDSRNIKKTEMLRYVEKALLEKEKNQKIDGIRVCERYIPMNSLLKINGAYYYLGGKTDNNFYIKNAMQFKLDEKWIKYISKIEKANRIKDYSEVDKFKNNIIIKEKNQKLYNLIINKLENLPYSKSKKSEIVKSLEDSFNFFCESDISLQCDMIEKILLNINKSKSLNIKITEATGIMRINSRIDNNTEFKLISQSVTGLFESETDLLKI